MPHTFSSYLKAIAILLPIIMLSHISDAQVNLRKYKKVLKQVDDVIEGTKPQTKPPARTPRPVDTSVNRNRTVNRPQPARPSAQSNRIDLGGHYTGTLYYEDKSRAYPLEIDIDTKNRYPEGSSSLTLENASVVFDLTIAGPKYERNGTFDEVAFVDKSLVSETGSGVWCKKFYQIDDIEYWEDSLVFTGTWRSKAVYVNKELIEDTTGACYPGTFRIVKAADNRQFSFAVPRAGTGCISGDCQNGTGVQISYFGRYEGQFKNGQREGQGKFEYTRGVLTGTKYEGHFSRNDFHGFGKTTFVTNISGVVYHEGNYVNGMRHGNGTYLFIDGKKYVGAFSHNQIWGLGRRVNGPLSRINYYEYDDIANNRALPLSTVKQHQDTVFAKFKKCDCLKKKTFSIPSWKYENVNYDLISSYTGKKVGQTTESELALTSMEVDGFVNNTDHNIYIRCYRKFFYKDRDVTEYIDDSYMVEPGQEIMANYRLQPQPGELYNLYFANTFIFVGQYCDKTAADCKPVVKKK